MKLRTIFLATLAAFLAIGVVCLWGSGRLHRATPAANKAVEPVARTVPTPAAAGPAGVVSLQTYQHPEEQPAWCIPYGKEFWHRPRASAPDPASRIVAPHPAINLAAVIDRVSHALQAGPGSPPAVRAETYAATLDQAGLRFSPDRPPAAAPAASSATTSRATPDEQPLAALAARTPETPEEEDALMARLSAQAQADAGAQSAPQRSGDARRAPAQPSDPHSRPQPDAQTEAAFETVSLQQGRRVLFAANPSPPTWAVLGNTA